MTPMETVFEREFSLKTHGKARILVGHLPDGDFIYPVKIINPYQDEIEVTFLCYGWKKLLNTKTTRFSFKTVTIYFSFSIPEGEMYRDIEVRIALTKGSLVKVHLPTSPRLHQKIETFRAALQETIGNIRAELDLSETSAKSPKKYLPAESKSPQAAISETKQTISGDMRAFRGILTIEKAQRQLDYVIYNKIFSTEGISGFKKFKLKLYKKVVVVLYRRLSKNAARRKYFAKLYRNYINNNIIADNLQAI
jgi:hypothetical protein